MDTEREHLVAGEFGLRSDLLYLNHAAVAPWPQRTRRAVERFAQENVTTGALHYPRWVETETRLRQRLATLIGAPSPDEIALLKNTSEGLSVIAWGLPWRAGDNIVSSDEEFPSNRIVWESLRDRGVELRQVHLDRADPERALLEGMDENTRLLAISSVQYASGLRLDLQRLGEWCRSRGVLFCVDGIQSVGALCTDVQRDHIDFLVADGHKWMLGPEGVALFYCRAELRDRLRLHQYGWHMVEQHQDYELREWQVAASARRFECGSPNMLGIHALEASLSLLQEYGMAAVEEKVLENGRFLLDAIGELDRYELLTPTKKSSHAGIVTFRHRHLPGEELYRRLTREKVICALRGGGIRLSPHFHTGRAVLERVVSLLAQW